MLTRTVVITLCVLFGHYRAAFWFSRENQALEISEDFWFPDGNRDSRITRITISSLGGNYTGKLDEFRSIWNRSEVKSDLNVNARMRIEIELNESEVDFKRMWTLSQTLKANLWLAPKTYGKLDGRLRNVKKHTSEIGTHSRVYHFLLHLHCLT